MGLLSQSLVIFRKNVTVKKHPKKVFNTLMEICMPVFYAAFIYCFVGVLVYALLRKITSDWERRAIRPRVARSQN